MDEGQKSSRLSGFYDQSLAQRAALVAKWADLSPEAQAAFGGIDALSTAQADHMIENVVGVFSLPLGVAANFVVNGRDVLVPMAVEEPSVVAGASFMARLARNTGGFRATASAPEMIGQLLILDVPDAEQARIALLAAKARIMQMATAVDPVLAQLGGGARDLEVRVLAESPIGLLLVLHLIYDTRDAMGANAVNTALETIAPLVAEISGGRVHLRILSNLADRRLATASATFRAADLAFGEFSGAQVRDGVIAAWAFAVADPYRAATHNKGIMNGVDAVVLATGNDWRAIEAGAHAYAARSGRYTSLSTWACNADGDLTGSLEMPLAVGIVGGATRAHPTARAALQVLGVRSAAELAQIIVSVGLAQNLAALRALATEGIQRGHMGLHARQIALAAGARADQVEAVANQLVREHALRTDRALEILQAN